MAAALLSHAPVGFAQADEPQPTLSVTIAAQETEYRVGDEIPITFTVTNVSDVPYFLSTRNYDRSGRMREYRLSAVDENGRELADPRASYPGGFGGGLGGAEELTKDESGEMTIALNRWCVLTSPGRYTVTGRYSAVFGGGQVLESPPIQIRVLPRTSAEFRAYLATLQAECERLGPNPSSLHLRLEPKLPQEGGRGRSADAPTLGDERRHLIQRLMYTHDRAIVPVLIDQWYDWPDEAFWMHEAFVYYLANKQECYEAIRKAAIDRGLQPLMLRTMENIGPPDQDHSDIVARALASGEALQQYEAVQHANDYWRDEFGATVRALASEQTLHEIARRPAIHALGLHPSAENDKTLDALLNDSNPSIQSAAQDALDQRKPDR